MNAATAELIRIAEELRDLEIDDGDVIGELQAALAVRNLADHRAAMLAGALARLDVAARGGRRPREVLMALGCAPQVAARLLRVGAAAEALPVVMAHAADGALSGEHVDAVVKGANHIRTRSAGPVDEDARYRHQVDLLGQALSGAGPAKIADRARKLGNQLAEEQDGLPAAEDRSINEIHCVKTSEGRWRVPGGGGGIWTPKWASNSPPPWRRGQHHGPSPTAHPIPGLPSDAAPTPWKGYSTPPHVPVTAPHRRARSCC